MKAIFSSEERKDLWNKHTKEFQNSLDNLQSVFHFDDEEQVTFILIYITIHLHITIKKGDEKHLKIEIF